MGEFLNEINKNFKALTRNTNLKDLRLVSSPDMRLIIKNKPSKNPYRWDSLVLYDLKNQEQIGKADYSKPKGSKGLFLHNIYISNTEHLNKGLATCLLMFLEKIAFDNGSTHIEGVFHPKDKKNSDKLLLFYKKNNYDVKKGEQNSYIYKHLNEKEINNKEKKLKHTKLGISEHVINIKSLATLER